MGNECTCGETTNLNGTCDSFGHYICNED